MTDEEVEGFIGDLEARLATAEAAILEVEGVIATAQLLRSAVGDGRQAMAEVMAPISARLNSELANLLVLPDTVIAGLENLSGQLEAAPEDAAALLDEVEGRLEGLLEDLASLTEELCVQATEAIDGAAAELDARLAGLTEGVDDLLDSFEDGIGVVEELLDDTVGQIDAIREAGLRQALDFVEHLDGSLGRITDGLEEIERVIEPVMPVISALESVT